MFTQVLDKSIDYPDYPLREAFDALYDYLIKDEENKICFLTGFRSTGKTVLLLQCAQKLNRPVLYMACSLADTRKDIISILSRRYFQGYRYFVVERINLSEDRDDSIDGLYDWVKDKDVKIVITADFIDRPVLNISMSFLSFKEYRRIFNADFKSYLMYGGNMNLDTFKSKEDTDSFIDASIIYPLERILKPRDYSVRNKVREIIDYYIHNNHGYEDCYIKDCLKRCGLLKAVRSYSLKGISEYEYLLYPGLYYVYGETDLMKIAHNVLLAELDNRGYKVSRCIIDKYVYVVIEDDTSISAISSDENVPLPDKLIEQIYQKKLVKYINGLDKFYEAI